MRGTEIKTFYKAKIGTAAFSCARLSALGGVNTKFKTGTDTKANSKRSAPFNHGKTRKGTK